MSNIIITRSKMLKIKQPNDTLCTISKHIGVSVFWLMLKCLFQSMKMFKIKHAVDSSDVWLLYKSRTYCSLFPFNLWLKLIFYLRFFVTGSKINNRRNAEHTFWCLTFQFVFQFFFWICCRNRIHISAFVMTIMRQKLSYGTHSIQFIGF